MKNKSIKKNYIYNTIYQILILITPLITTPYVSRILGADGIGKVSYAESIVAYFVLFANLGVGLYGQREISYVQDDENKRSIVFWNTFVLKFIISIFVLIVYLLFYLLYFKSFLYLIFIFEILNVVIDITWFFYGLEEFGKIVFRNILIKLFNILFIFLFIKNRNDVNLYAFGISFFTFFSGLVMWPYLKKYVKKVDIKNLKPFNDVLVVISLFIPTIAIQIYTVLDKTMIGIITKNSFENGYYEQAMKISKMVLMVVTALGTVTIPRVGFYFGKNDTESIKNLMYRSYKFVWFLGIPLCFGLTLVSDNFVPWFFGPGYDKVSYLLKILAFLLIAIGINNVTGIQYLIPTKRQNTFTFTVIIGAIVNFFMNLVLIKCLNSIGAAIASVVAESVIAIIQLIIVRKELSFIKILKVGINYYIAGLVMILSLYFIRNRINVSFVSTVILVAIGGVVYIGTLFLLKDDFLIKNCKVVLVKMNQILKKDE